MPEKKTEERVERARREDKAPTTQAGEFVREEMEHIKVGKHGARSPEQAIAIGLSKARRAGIKVPAPKRGKVSAAARKKAAQDSRKGAARTKRKPSPTRSRATTGALQREGHGAASKAALSRH